MILSPRIINHIAQTACVEMNQICAPLLKVGIRLFMYMRIYPNTTGFALSSDPAWHQFYLTNFYQLRYPSSIQFANEIQGKVFFSRELFPNVREFADADEFYDFGNGIGLVKQFNQYKEFCYFAANKQSTYIINYYLNNMEYLEYFISYFKDKAAKIIQVAEKTKVPLPKEYLALTKKIENCNDYQQLNKELLSHLSHEKISIFNGKEEVYFTKKQLAVINWLLHGKSTEEIGIILNLSKRTVEEHISNIKNKLNCYKNTQLIYKLGKLNIFDILVNREL